MSEDDVKSRIKTPAVLQAFELAKIRNLPAEVQAAYEAQDTEFSRYSQNTAELVAKGKKEGEKKAKLEIAQNLLKLGFSTEQIATTTNLSVEEIAQLK